MFLQLKYYTKAFNVKLSRNSILEQIQLSTYNMPESYYFEKQINFQHLVIKCKSETNQKLIANTSTGPVYGFALWFCYLFLTKIIYADNLVGIFLIEFLL